ncbi:MAG: RNA polymerase sigma factor [Kofleriaceae bacterium]
MSAQKRERKPESAERARRKRSRPVNTKAKARAYLFSPARPAEVKRWLRRLGLEESAVDDVSQEVLLGAFKSFDTYAPVLTDARSWLHAITRYQKLKHEERAAVRRDRPRARVKLGAHEVDVEDALTTDVQLRALRAAMMRLQPEEREVLVRHDLDEVEMHDVSILMNRPECTLWKVRKRALSSLARALAPYRCR